MALSLQRSTIFFVNLNLFNNFQGAPTKSNDEEQENIARVVANLSEEGDYFDLLLQTQVQFNWRIVRFPLGSLNSTTLMATMGDDSVNNML